ncbi:putative protein kinase RLK-Pelle-LRR-III family [Helianthus annuus]|nr:putative protein kinase RLK-Pelle-LRR-III family [Helianthus annuus]
MMFRVLLVVVMFIVPVMGQLPSQDILALLEFKKGIKHDPTGFVLSSWNEESIDFNGCPSSWNGIMCNGGNVAGVVLDHLSLSADVDLNVFANLTKLVKLSISNNSISGKFPTKLGGMLEFLDVSDNLFNSSLPVDVGKDLSLKNMSLAGNNFSGPIPDWVSGISSIQSLDLSRNSFSGAIPASFTQLSNLVYLNLSVNGFTKSIPEGFEDMAVLEVLDLHGNMLVGDFDPKFLLLTTAVHVDFSGNSLTTSSGQSEKFLPGISETVKYLNLSRNRLTGSLVGGGVAEMFGSLVVLDLSYNELSGELPSFNYAYDLQVLKLSNNRFSGFFPNDLLKGDSLVLTELDLSGNNLTGSISMIMSTSLQVLNLSGNGLTGELPLVTGGCLVLDLSKNNFQGNLTKLVKWGNLEFLDLSQNRLTGSFPELTAQFLRLNHLNLSHNSLDSSIPKVITQLPKLTVLDLGFNRFDGPFPNGLISMPTLQQLHLSRAPAEVLGRSSHGTSYRTTLDNGLSLTVKWLREGVAKQRKDFAKEAKKFANIRHPNVVGLRGYYWGPTQYEKLILSDFISPGSLASFLYDRPGRKGPPLTWAQRLKIAVDIARGLNYLHFDRAIPHGNLKATNILLDGADLNARVADYCLHRLMTQAGTVEQILDAGVLGYRAPELAASKRPVPSFKSDIYAFGVILLELLTGKCAGDVVSSEDGGGVDLNDWVRLKVAEGRGPDCFDAVLITEMGTPAADKGMKEVLGIALRCIRPLNERPGIKTVYEDLSSI